MLLPQTPVKAAEAKAEELRGLIEQHRFREMEKKSRLTVSIGVSSYPIHKIQDKDDIITLADKALYKAKVLGRNTVVLYNSRM